MQVNKATCRFDDVHQESDEVCMMSDRPDFRPDVRGVSCLGAQSRLPISPEVSVAETHQIIRWWLWFASGNWRHG